MKTLKILLDFGLFVAILILAVAVIFANLSFGMKLSLSMAALLVIASIVYDKVKK